MAENVERIEMPLVTLLRNHFTPDEQFFAESGGGLWIISNILHVAQSALNQGLPKCGSQNSRVTMVTTSEQKMAQRRSNVP